MALLLKDEILGMAHDPNIRLLGNSFDEKSIQGCSYDLRVGCIFKGNKPYSENFLSKESPTNVVVHPSEIVTMLTFEEVKMPRNLAGTVFPMNSLSSIGFLILNPGHIDPGYNGPISICAINLSNVTISLQLYHTKIFTILFEKLDGDAIPYKNPQFNNRKEREDHFLAKKARLLSTSVFDIIKLHNYKKHLQNLISDILTKYVIKFLTISGIVLGIFWTLYQMDNVIKNKLQLNNSEQFIDSIKNVSKALEKRTDSLQNILDSAATNKKQQTH